MVVGATLGLKLQNDKAGVLVFRRGNEITEMITNVSRLKSSLSVWETSESLSDPRVDLNSMHP